MSIQLNKRPGMNVLELGGGDSPHPQSDVRVDIRHGPFTHFTQDFEQFPWAIGDNEFDCVYAHFLLEHLSYANIPIALQEIYRVLKPGGTVIVAVPNTMHQFNWIRTNPNGWDGKDYFTAASELIFGSQTYNSNYHKSFWSYTSAQELFTAAGFIETSCDDYGARDTDMVVLASKPLKNDFEISEKELVKLREDFVGREGDHGRLLVVPRVYKIEALGKEIVDVPFVSKKKFAFDWGGCLEKNQHLRDLAKLLHAKGHEVHVIPATGLFPTEGTYAQWLRALGVPFHGIHKVMSDGVTPEVIAAGKVVKMRQLGCHILYDDNQCNLDAVKAAGMEAIRIDGDNLFPYPPEAGQEQSPAMAPGAISFPPNIEPTQFRSKERFTAEEVGNVMDVLEQQAPETIPLKEWQQSTGGTLVDLTAPTIPLEAKPTLNREEMFDKAYFNGGGKVGGYAREGYWDFPVHNITAAHVLARKPESVLEVGCSRGYVLKRIIDAGVPGQGIEISKHCIMTRACDGITQWDVCKLPWPFKDKQFDLVYSVATFEHIPEQFIVKIIEEMDRVGKRGLHGIDFGGHDDGFDKTHVTLKPQGWWLEQFEQWSTTKVEVVDKESLEQGTIDPAIFSGDGKLKLNLGSFSTMFHHGWTNIDIHDMNMTGVPQHHGYKFQHCDVRQGLPYATGSVDLIFSSHMLEHLSYDEGLKLLRECRRVIKPDGAMRLMVPDAARLIAGYAGHNKDLVTAGLTVPDISEYDEVNDGAANAKTDAAKLWELLLAGDHKAIYDAETLGHLLLDAGWTPYPSQFRKSLVPGCQQIIREVVESHPCLSLVMDAVPLVS